MNSKLLFIFTFLFSLFSYSSALVIKDRVSKNLFILSHIYLYGDEIIPKSLSENLEKEINDVWNKLEYYVNFERERYKVNFKVSLSKLSERSLIQVARRLTGVDGYNFIRVLKEPTTFVQSSFIVSDKNSGVWLLPQLLEGGKTASHEYGHSLGLLHPEGSSHKGKPRLMITDYYDVDPIYRLKPDFIKLDKSMRGLRKVDLDELRLSELVFDEKEESFLGDASFIFLYDGSGNMIQF